VYKMYKKYLRQGEDEDKNWSHYGVGGVRVNS
jgi:hypothetical protein